MSFSVVDVREEEFFLVAQYFRPGLKVLEIGGGNGYQASLIHATGANIISIDIATPPPGIQPYFPVQIYNGRHIPFPEEEFDVIFSSNVLEHIRDLEAIFSQIRRVIKPDGLVIHILPTPTWRLWESLSYMSFISKRAFDIIFRHNHKSSLLASQVANQKRVSGKAFALVKGFKEVMIGGIRPHGEYPSALSELWYYRKRRWTKVFQENGFRVVKSYPSGLLYTQYCIFLFPWLSIKSAKRLARLLGSATQIYILQKAG